METLQGIGKNQKSQARVRLMQSGGRRPADSVEQMIRNFLCQEGPKDVAKVVKRVAMRIYQDELRQGARLLDIGLFGAKLFEPEVAKALRSGMGVLWTDDPFEPAKGNLTRGLRKQAGVINPCAP
jgi:hypothetical protein